MREIYGLPTELILWPPAMLGYPAAAEDPGPAPTSSEVARVVSRIPATVAAVDGKLVVRFPAGWRVSPGGFIPPDDREG